MIFSRTTHRHGFSMVELSISLAILGVLLSGSLLVATILIEDSALDDTVERIDLVNDALQAFAQTHGRLPCPAGPELLRGETNYGNELFSSASGQICTRTGDGMRHFDGGGTNLVSIGTVPVRRMGLPDKYMADAYGNRFIYAVSETLVNTASYTATVGGNGIEDTHQGSIIIDGRPVPAAYVLVSTGKDGKGARTYKEAAEKTNCPTSSTVKSEENCDTDRTFSDQRYNDGEDSTNYFDDIIRYTPKFILRQLSLSGIDGLCTNNNLDLVLYEEDAQRFYRCVATDVNTDQAVWQLLSTINTATSPVATVCQPHHRGLVRKTPSDVNTGDLQYCSEAGTWEDITL